jgi:hypothetical protein
MRRLPLASAILLLACPAAAAELGVVVTNVTPETGELRVLVTPETKVGEAVPTPRQALAASRSGGQAAVRLPGLEPGAYEVVVQDLAARSLARGRVDLTEPATSVAVPLAPVSQGDNPIHPNAVELYILSR